MPEERALKLSTSRHNDADVRISAIDIGSNSIRQIIADVSPAGAIRVVDEMKAAPRLGAGLHTNGRLGDEAMDEAIAVLSRMGSLADQLGAKRTRVVATSAVRDADNGSEWLARVREETGLRVTIVSGEEEARLGFRSAVAHFDLATGRAVVMDIGGGSLEVALSAGGLVDRLISLPLGTLRLTERFLGKGATPAAIRKLRRKVRGRLRDELSAREWRGAQIIGSGGTFTNLGGIMLARQGLHTARSPHGTIVSRADLEHVVSWLGSLSEEERRSVPGLNPARADIIVAGLAVAAEMLARIEAGGLVVSSYGIREGILLDLARVSPAPADHGEARDRSVRDLAERSHYEKPHSHQVQRLALQLFDALGRRIGCQPEDRDTLADAALLHDIGYHISYDKHHKHSYHLISHAELLGMTPAEQVAIANVARYHRGAEPRKTHRNFGSLDSGSRERIRRIAAILRVADGFDRGHSSAVGQLKVRWLERAIRITAAPALPDGNVRLELWGASRKSRLLSEVAGLPVEIVGPSGEVVTYDDDAGRAD